MWFYTGGKVTNMKWARKINNFAVDVRNTNPEGFFTFQVVNEFIVVPDEVQDHWFFDDETQTWLTQKPQPVEPTIEITRVGEAGENTGATNE